jgi:hypothetical protein
MDKLHFDRTDYSVVVKRDRGRVCYRLAHG